MLIFPNLIAVRRAGVLIGTETYLNLLVGTNTTLTVTDDPTNGEIEVTVDATEQAPSTADYLVGTAQAGLSAEIVVGATPGGELGGTWAAPTVDAVHSGSAHPTGGTPAVGLGVAGAAGVSASFLRVDDTLLVFDTTLPVAEAFGDAGSATLNGAAITARRDHRHAMPADPVTAHVAAADPHVGYVLESLIDAKGDLIAGTAADAVARLAVGTNGLALVADSAAATGLKWGSVIKSIQQGTIAVTTLASGLEATATATITSVDTAKAYVVWQGHTVADIDSAGTGVTLASRVTLTNATTVTATGQSSVAGGQTLTVGYVVVEFS